MNNSFHPRKLRVLSFLTFAAVYILCLPLVAGAASSSPGLGKTVDEIEKLAIKEGKVRIASSLTNKEEKLVLAGFRKKYPQITVETTRISGIDEGEKIFTEVLGGLIGYDVVKITTELQTRFLKAGILAGPFEWKRIFPKIHDTNISPDRYFVATSFSPRVMAYNPKMVPAQRVPKKWEDVLDPYWKGKFVLDTRPHTLISLYHAWGEKKILDYAKKVAENKPIWQREQSAMISQLSAGEFGLVVGVSSSVIDKTLRDDPKANVAVAWPDIVPVRLNEMLGILKDSPYPNAAFLLSAWLASPEGQVGYDKVGRGSPFLEGTDTWKDFKKAGAKPIFGGWDEAIYNPPIAEKVIAIWGFR